MLERLKRKIFPPDEWRIVRSGPNENREVIETLDHAPDSDLWELDHDGILEPGTYRCQAVRNGKFGEMAWSVVIGDPQKAREIDELRREIREMRSDSRAPTDFNDQLKRATFQAVLEGELDVTSAKQLAGLSVAFDGKEKSGLSESVEDPKDLGEIAGRTVLNLMDDPTKLEQVSKAGGSATSAFLDGALGELDQNGHEPAQADAAADSSQVTEEEEEQQARRDDDEVEPREPALRQRFEDLEDPEEDEVEEDEAAEDDDRAGDQEEIVHA